MTDVLTDRTRELFANAEIVPICPCSPLNGHIAFLWYDGLGTVYGSDKDMPQVDGVIGDLRRGVVMADDKGPLSRMAFEAENSSTDEAVLKQIVQYRLRLEERSAS